MSRTYSVTARVDLSAYNETKELLSVLGLSVSDAINLFLIQCSLCKGLPFDVKIPNDDTINAMNDARLNNNLESFENADKLFESWDE